jgi:predicted PurR-regulated permease PerM
MPQHQHVTLTYSTIFRVVIVLLALFLLYLVREIIALVFVSIVLAAAFDPWVDWFEKYKIPRAIAILMIYVIILAVLGITIILLIPPVSEQISQIAHNFPFYYQKLSEVLSNLQNETSQDTSSQLPTALETISATLTGATKSIFATISSLFGGLISLIAVLVLVFYMTVEEEFLKKFILLLTPQTYQDHLIGLINRIQKKIGMWLRGQLTLCLIVAMLVYLGLTLLGVKYALLLAIIAGILEIVPFVGPTVSAIPAVFVAFSDSLVKVLLVVLLYFIVQQFENHVIVPKVMQKAVGLNPIIVIVVVLVGAKLGGVLGALLAVPVAAAIGVFLSDVWPHLLEVKEK